MEVKYLPRRRRWKKLPRDHESFYGLESFHDCISAHFNVLVPWKQATASTEGRTTLLGKIGRTLPRKIGRKLPRKIGRKLPRKRPRIRKLQRKHFQSFLRLSSMKASGSFHGRLEAHRLPRKVPRKLPVKAVKIASMKDWKVHPMIFFVSFPRTLP